MLTDDELVKAIKAAEKRGYAKGYKAGAQRTKAETEKWNALHDHIAGARTEKRVQIFCAVLNGFLPSCGWSIGDKPVKTTDDYLSLAQSVTDKAMSKLGIWL